MEIFTANLGRFMVGAYFYRSNYDTDINNTTAGPRLTVNCLTDHRTWYNLQVSGFALTPLLVLNTKYLRLDMSSVDPQVLAG